MVVVLSNPFATKEVVDALTLIEPSGVVEEPT